jgi:hypothetical protein
MNDLGLARRANRSINVNGRIEVVADPSSPRSSHPGARRGSYPVHRAAPSAAA